MTARALSGQAQARAVVGARVARGQALRFEVWRADDRVWPLCLDDQAQVRGGGGTAWTWTKPCAVALRFIPASGAHGRANAPVLRGRARAAANNVRLDRKPKLTRARSDQAADHETLAELGIRGGTCRGRNR
jgi:hypothetical protein